MALNGNNSSSSNIIKDGDELDPQKLKKIDDKKTDQGIDKGTEPKKVWFFQLFRFAEKLDYLLMAIGSLAALTAGAAMPVFSYIMGDMIDAFESMDTMVQKSKETMLIFIYVGIGAFAAGWIMFASWMITGERQAIACRKAYLRSLLRQEIGWFDVINQTELSSRFSVDTFAFQGAIGEKVSTIIMVASTLIVGLILAFITGWTMTLVLLASFPALGIAGYFYMWVIENKDKNEQTAYSTAGGRAEQAISSIKTVKQLNGEPFEMVKYEECLNKAASKSFQTSLGAGAGIACLFFTLFASYALGFWFGSKCVLGASNCPESMTGGRYTAGDVLVVFFCIVMGGMQLSQLTPAFKNISEGRMAASRIFAIIDRQPAISNPVNGIKIENVKGIIRFENVTFRYPKDQHRKVFNNLTMEFDINKTGLVGESGCGKSTTLQLIMRFYDPEEGRVTLDGHDIRTLDLVWYRSIIGYVGQEPVLFATSIKQNLRFGNLSATDNDIKEALQMAEAWDFVQTLEDKLETYVGYGGGQLSGGQKQRIAIARAILRKPKIMLLDEATSALDRRNEKLIQDTLEKVTEGMTTITVAHRVKTIMNSDMIYLFDKGGIAEKGKFNEISKFKNYVDEKEAEEAKAKEQEEIEAEDKNFHQIDDPILKKIETQKQETASSKKEVELTREEKEKLYDQELLKKYEKSSFTRIFSYAKDRTPLFVIGIVCALGSGCVFPVFSIYLSKMLIALINVALDNTDQEAIDDVNGYALGFFIIAIICFILQTILITCFFMIGDLVTKRIRVETFYKILKMPVPWFDIPRNNAGILTTRLSTDCTTINKVTTTIVAVFVQSFATLISGVIIALVYEWRTALVALGLLPLLILAGAAQMAMMTGFSDKSDAAYKESTNIILEGLNNIRTVHSFGYEKIICDQYDKKMEEPFNLAVRKGNISGFFFGISQIIMFVIFGLLFWLGSIFVRDNPGDVSTEDMFIAIFSILFAGMNIGNNTHFLPDMSACKISAASLFHIQDSEDEEQLQVREGSKLLKEGADGDIVLEDVNFKYETRNEYVFKHMNIRIKKGNKVAFVGTSGCGKSTIIQLVQRFYFPAHGAIKIGGIDIKDFDIHYLRKTFGVVSQEPVLFNGTFAENMRYNLEHLTQEQIEQAARQASATSFIVGNEQVGIESAEGTGYNKNVGVRGSHISGGQKQRVAIARTILREPQILLLDEATSALDRDNEKKVQDSLDSIMHGKTVISIAHRIETIKNSDEIYMFEKGKIIESGSYNQLIAMKGSFYNLERGASFT